MKSYPVRAVLDHYGGRDPRKRAKTQRYNEVAARVQHHLNAELAKLPDDEVVAFYSFEIARALGEDSDLVHRIVFAMDGGSNGITVVKGDLDRAFAKRSQPPAQPVEAE